MIGRSLSHYQIVEPLDEGGMGVVYRARDLHLERDVAVKMLPSGTLADDDARRRFRREALALSQLNHPHVLAVYDFDTCEGVDFLVTELVPGTTLGARLRAGALREDEIVRLGLQICSALEAAHESGVIHRDLKPANIMVTPGGEAKVLDFGLARRLATESTDTRSSSTELTEAGAVVGTAQYLSPEVLQGHGADQRSDVWGLGVVLHEMAGGRPPFEGGTRYEVTARILHGEPLPVPESIPAWLRSVIEKCLEKRPDRRFADAGQVRAALSSPGSMPVAAPKSKTRRPRIRVGAMAIGAGSVAALLVAGGLLWFASGRGCPGFVPRIRSLAVLPIANLSGDPEQEYFADGMTDELITTLSQISTLRVISRTSVMHYKGTTALVPRIARELGVDGIIEGSVLRMGGQVRISAQLIQAANDRHLWSQSYQRDAKDVLTLQNDVARAIAEQVRAQLTPRERAQLSRAHAIDPAVHELYLRGRQYMNAWTKEGASQAVKSLERAIEIDPNYAQAHAALGNAYCAGSSSWWPAQEALPHALRSASRALELDSTIAEAHAVVGYERAFFEWDWSGAERDLDRALVFDPNSSFARSTLGYMLTVNGRFDEAITQLRLAHEGDPLSILTSSMELWPLNMGRRHQQAIEAAQRLLAVDSTAWNAHTILLQSYALTGHFDQALAEARLVGAFSSDSGAAGVGWILALAGRKAEARRYLERAERYCAGPNSTRLSVFYDTATLCSALGEVDRGIAYLRRALPLRQEDVVWAKVDPRLDGLRKDPRFDEILRQLHLAL